MRLFVSKKFCRTILELIFAVLKNRNRFKGKGSFFKLEDKDSL